ncbi:MAG: adenylate/guanylate cyclase domain-containing protein [Minwuia sp.]|uniref:adenylate/guanylate cyclase domain-containing protein n=1 Tax=Minwuia sp. TaxID=2493630 RepID=UPI003A84B2FC
MHLTSRARLYAGLILFVFVATHMANHALGIISVPAMDAGRDIFLFVWRSWIGTLVLVGALVVHSALVGLSAWRRRTWVGLSRTDYIQYVTGIVIPPLLVLHVLANRGLHELHGLDDTYAWVLMALWRLDPMSGVQQAILVVVTWVHGCVGVHMWLRLKPAYRPCIPAAYTAALLLVVLSLIGFVHGGLEIDRLAEDPVWMAAYREATALPPEAAAWVYTARDTAWTGMIVALLVFGASRAMLHVYERRKGLVTIYYPEDRRVSVEPGVTVLEASRRAGIPHASICGGRGRCSTCRVKIVDGGEGLPAMERQEKKVLRRIGAPEGVRLACQLKPPHTVSVIPLLPEPTPMKEAFANPGFAQGAERRIAILFADLRNFSRFAETKLPYDVVFVLNQYCRYMGEAVEAHGGRLDKFIGDGVMALFGIEAGGEAGARQALEAARTMSLALEQMNQALRGDLETPMRMGIGIHVGDVIVGEMGYRSVVNFTAIGDAVNIASRLEAANKSFGSQLVISKAVAEEAGLDLTGMEARDIEVPGRDRPVRIFVLDSAQDLPPRETQSA